MKKIVVLILFLSTGLNAQPKMGQALIDSLLRELNSSNLQVEENALNTAILVDLSYLYCSNDPDKGIQYGKKGLLMAENLGLEDKVGLAEYYLGANYCVKGDYPSALECWLKSLEIGEKLGNKKSNVLTLNNIGRVFVMQNNTNSALKYYNKALALNEELRDTFETPYILGDMGSAYEAGKNYEKALEYYNKALEINSRHGNKDGMADNIGNKGLVFMHQKDYPNALKNLFAASKLNQELENKVNMAMDIGYIGQCYLLIAKDTINKIVPNALIPAGKTANLQKAKEYLSESIEMCRETGDLRSIQEYSKYLSEVEELSGNCTRALGLFRESVLIKDSIFNIDNNIKISNLETKREIELKDKQIEIDKLAVGKRRIETWFALSGVGIMMGITLIVVRNNKKQIILNHLLSNEKQKSEHLLLNILPAEIGAELKEKGKADAKFYDNVTVLFTDFQNFTLTSEQMTPQELIDELDTCFKTFDEIMDQYGVEKIKTIGDAYLAISGLPNPDADHAEKVVLAAKEIIEYMSVRYEQLGTQTFRIRIGIHSGSVVAGIVGLKKFAYDIWGDTVNTAARMQQDGEAGMINISQATYELVKDKFTCEYRGEIEAKNKGKLKMYFVG